MLPGIGGESIRHLGEAIGRQGMRDEQDPLVRAMGREELKREANEIISIARDQAALLSGRPFELLPIRPSRCSDLVDTEGVDASSPEQLRNGGAEVLVEIEFHRG